MVSPVSRRNTSRRHRAHPLHGSALFPTFGLSGRRPPACRNSRRPHAFYSRFGSSRTPARGAHAPSRPPPGQGRGKRERQGRRDVVLRRGERGLRRDHELGPSVLPLRHPRARRGHHGHRPLGVLGQDRRLAGERDRLRRRLVQASGAHLRPDRCRLSIDRRTPVSGGVKCTDLGGGAVITASLFSCAERWLRARSSRTSPPPPRRPSPARPPLRTVSPSPSFSRPPRPRAPPTALGGAQEQVLEEGMHGIPPFGARRRAARARRARGGGRRVRRGGRGATLDLHGARSGGSGGGEHERRGRGRATVSRAPGKRPEAPSCRAIVSGGRQVRTWAPRLSPPAPGAAPCDRVEQRAAMTLYASSTARR